jgi:hypothetical protein
MSVLHERLKAALEPRYLLREEAGAGGMARVFRAEDTTLGRDVAVKVLRPESATAVGAERFQREARALAAVSHPNVVPVHETGTADGVLYYIMDFVDAPTLRNRLESGPLDPGEVCRLGLDLLSALQATHAGGVIHRDVKPENLFLCRDRVLLADFGIATEIVKSDSPLTEADSPGTPAYMAPEQADGTGASASSDLYAVALVLFEAFTGRRWPRFQAPERGNWKGVPRRLRGVLGRGLDPDPDRRWPDASSFRQALAGACRNRPTLLRAAVLLFAGLSMFLLWWAWPKPPPPVTADLAVLPCSYSGVDRGVARFVRSYAATELNQLRDLHVLSDRQTLNAWDRRADELRPDDWVAWGETLRASRVTGCRILASGEEWRVTASLHDRARGSHGPFQQSVARGDSIGAGLALFHLLLEATGEAGLTDVSAEEAGVLRDYSSDAVVFFLDGKESFREDALRDATERFTLALAAEPDFALAEWHLAEAQRWLAHAAVEVDLADLFRRGARRLPVRDSMLLEARLAPYSEKPERLREVAERYPDEAYPTLLYADELYHRGGLWGEPIDSAVALFESAVRKDSGLAPAVEHLTQASIRMGLREESAAALEQLFRVSGDPGQHDVYYPAVWGQAWHERFSDPATARAGFDELISGLGPTGSPGWALGMLEFLRIGCRWVRYVELPASQSMLGRQLLGLAREMRSPDDAAAGWLAIALGAIGRGRIDEAVAAFDSIAYQLGSIEAKLQAAEWRVVPWALGLEGFEQGTAEVGASQLAAAYAMETSPSTRARIALSLAMYEHRREDPGDADAWGDSLLAAWASTERGPDRWNPLLLLESQGIADRGDAATAVERSSGLVAYDSVALLEYPFGRASSYWLRARWQAEAGDAEGALRTLYWHENTDLEEGTRPGIAQAAELDAALGVHARAEAVRLAVGAGERDPIAGLPRCRLVASRAADLSRLWRDPDPDLVPLRDEILASAAATARECEE